MATSDNSDMKEIDHELDKLALRALTLMNELIAAKLDLEKAVKAGSLDLAKARYIMGNRNVSALQLPTPGEGADVSPLVTVHRADTFQGSSSQPDVENIISLQLERTSLSDESKKHRNQALKKRTVDGSEEQRPLLDEEEEEEEKEDSGKDGGSRSSSPQDPIKWFGVLVPQNLRQGQTRFKKAVELVVHTANIQLELQATVTQYKRKKISAIEQKKNSDLVTVHVQNSSVT